MAKPPSVHTERAHRHAAFSYTYRVLARLGEAGSLARLRRQTLQDARGRLLIVGAGQLHDVAHVPPAVTEVIAVEPDPTMRRLGRRRAASSGIPVHYLGALAERLPLRDESIDSVLLTLVFCSVHRPQDAARELRRVLRADGAVYVLEHVRAPEGSRIARWQDRVDPAWRHVSGGCHMNRRTAEVLRDAGFDTAALRDRRLTKVLPLLDPAVQGIARPR